VGASRLWWKRFVAKVSFEPGMKSFEPVTYFQFQFPVVVCFYTVVDVK